MIHIWNTQLELRHLRYFAAVAEERHFTRAAARLGIGQPPLSQQIQSLERELGTLLFRRLPRGVELTAAGEAFLVEARAILAQVERAVDTAQRVARGERGRLRVGMINSAPFHPFVPRVIREYGLRYPDVALSLDEKSTPALATDLLEQRLDVAFTRPLAGDDSRLLSETLFDEPVLVALPQGHRLSEYASLPLTVLASEALVLFPRAVGAGLYDEIISACRRAGFSPNVVQEASQVTSIVNLVAAGLGLSLVPASMQQVHSEGVTYRPIFGDAPVARLVLIRRATETGDARVNHLVELARSMIGRM